LKKLCIILSFGLLAALPLRAADDSPSTVNSITDVDDKIVTFKKPGVVTVVLGCSEDTQKACRLASYSFDQFRGRRDFRLIVIVDLRNSLGGLLKGYVRDRMRTDLDSEAARLKLYYENNQNFGNPRDDLCAIPDFSGQVCRQMGWDKSLDDALHAVVIGPNGAEVRRWDNLKNYGELQSTIAKVLPLPDPSRETGDTPP
jgi:hypothetical protein